MLDDATYASLISVQIGHKINLLLGDVHVVSVRTNTLIGRILSAGAFYVTPSHSDNYADYWAFCLGYESSVTRDNLDSFTYWQVFFANHY